MSRDQHPRRRGRRDDRHWRQPRTIIRHWADTPWGLTSGPVTGAAAAATKWAGRTAHDRLTAARAARLGSMSHQQRLTHIAHLERDRHALAGAPLSVHVAAALKLAWARFRVLDPAVQGLAGLIGGAVALLTVAWVALWVLIEAAFLLPLLVAVTAWGMRARTHKVSLSRYLVLTARTVLPTITRAERDRLHSDGAPTARWTARVVVRWLVALLRHDALVTAVTLAALTTGLAATVMRVTEAVLAVSRPAWWQPAWGDLDMLVGLTAAISTAALFGIARHRRTTAETILLRQAAPGTDHTEEA